MRPPSRSPALWRVRTSSSGPLQNGLLNAHEPSQGPPNVAEWARASSGRAAGVATCQGSRQVSLSSGSMAPSRDCSREARQPPAAERGGFGKSTERCACVSPGAAWQMQMPMQMQMQPPGPGWVAEPVSVCTTSPSGLSGDPRVFCSRAASLSNSPDESLLLAPNLGGTRSNWHTEAERAQSRPRTTLPPPPVGPSPNEASLHTPPRRRLPGAPEESPSSGEWLPNGYASSGDAPNGSRSLSNGSVPTRTEPRAEHPMGTAHARGSAAEAPVCTVQGHSGGGSGCCAGHKDAPVSGARRRESRVPWDGAERSVRGGPELRPGNRLASVSNFALPPPPSFLSSPSTMAASIDPGSSLWSQKWESPVTPVTPIYFMVLPVGQLPVQEVQATGSGVGSAARSPLSALTQPQQPPLPNFRHSRPPSCSEDSGPMFTARSSLSALGSGLTGTMPDRPKVAQGGAITIPSQDSAEFPTIRPEMLQPLHEKDGKIKNHLSSAMLVSAGVARYEHHAHPADMFDPDSASSSTTSPKSRHARAPSESSQCSPSQAARRSNSRVRHVGRRETPGLPQGSWPTDGSHLLAAAALPHQQQQQIQQQQQQQQQQPPPPSTCLASAPHRPQIGPGGGKRFKEVLQTKPADSGVDTDPGDHSSFSSPVGRFRSALCDPVRPAGSAPWFLLQRQIELQQRQLELQQQQIEEQQRILETHRQQQEQQRQLEAQRQLQQEQEQQHKEQQEQRQEHSVTAAQYVQHSMPSLQQQDLARPATRVEAQGVASSRQLPPMPVLLGSNTITLKPVVSKVEPEVVVSEGVVPERRGSNTFGCERSASDKADTQDPKSGPADLGAWNLQSADRDLEDDSTDVPLEATVRPQEEWSSLRRGKSEIALEASVPEASAAYGGFEVPDTSAGKKLQRAVSLTPRPNLASVCSHLKKQSDRMRREANAESPLSKAQTSAHEPDMSNNNNNYNNNNNNNNNNNHNNSKRLQSLTRKKRPG
ncbi:unnamed protein product [Polarella glacialis]|uniref:Uncharacterized protein n=1 Tax=Polarella glacialis TaxID=89957 RepID=A0A813E359_POLGL|nr:unnamed protein product [Polarella glacialis]